MANAVRTALEESWIVEREKALAWLRLAFAILAIAVIQLNPSRVERFPMLSVLSLTTFLAYSAVILYLLYRSRVGSSRLIVITTPIDMLWVALIVFSTGGSRTPFFIYYSFPVISASFRWGIRGSLPVAFAGVAIYLAIRVTLAAESGGQPLGIDTVVVRGFYLIALAAIFGYVSEFERRQNQRLLALSQTANQISALQERRHIMFDLHDGILQSLATLILRLEHCRRNLERPTSEIESELHSLEELTRGSMHDIREFLAGKETKPLAPGSLLKRLREELRFLQQGLNMQVILDTAPEEVDLPQAVETEVYYVLREGLANVTRHSQASRVDLHLTQTDNLLMGDIEDNGAGMNLIAAQNGQGLGLQSMRERIKKIGGELFIKSAPGSGTKISFTVPLTT